LGDRGQLEPTALAVTLGCTLLFLAVAIFGYDPARGFMQARRPA
jgi:hypothetical protein